MKTLSIKVSGQLPQFSLQVEHKFDLTGIIGIFGHSGAGKSSLLKAVAGIKNPLNGFIALNQQVLLDDQQGINITLEKRNIVGVFQQTALFPHLNVEQNLLYGRNRLKQPKLDAQKLIDICHLAPLLSQSPEQLSGGERQKVAIVRALLAEPELLILDEPLTGLDSINKNIMLTEIAKLNKTTQTPILYVSHNLAELQFLAEQILVLSQGKISHFGDTHAVIHQLNNTGLIQEQTSFSATLDCQNEVKNHGLISLKLDYGQTIFTTNQLLTQQQVATNNSPRITCYIFADDISVCLQAPLKSSIVNKLSGKLLAIEPQSQQILLTIDCQGQTFFAKISSYSFDQLALTIGDSVYLQFKASAVKTAVASNANNHENYHH